MQVLQQSPNRVAACCGTFASAHCPRA
jgi:hypothetical protein